MSDQRGDQYNRGDWGGSAARGEDERHLPGELGDVHGRLLRDGAAWRTGVPDNERLNARVRTVPRELPGGLPAAGTTRVRDDEVGRSSQPGSSWGRDMEPWMRREMEREMERGDSMRSGSMRSGTSRATRTMPAWVGGAVAVVVVGLLAAVLVHMAGGAIGGSSPARVTVPTPTAPGATATVAPSSDPTQNGWTQVAPGQFDGMAFAPSSPQWGYLCSVDDSTQAHGFGVTTDGGQTWKMSASPAAYYTCLVQVSATNPLDVALVSINEPGSGDAAYVDAHYSMDAGTTWKAVPIPEHTLVDLEALWAGPYLYVWSSPNKDSGQHGFLQVSDDGGPFTSIDPNTMFSGAQNAGANGLVTAGTRIYTTLGYTSCSTQACYAIVWSSDGGKTWTQVPNKGNIWLDAVVGSTLYGSVREGPNAGPVLSADNGATWSTPPALPPLPNGQTITSCVPAADGVCYTAFPGLGVAYLRSGAWTVIPFSASRQTSVDLLAVSVDVNGHAVRVWVQGGGKSPGIYWHTRP